MDPVDSKITTFEEEFLAHIMIPGGATFGEWAAAQLPAIYANGKMPPMLGMGAPAGEIDQ
jgi:hypothetical protein